MNLATLLLGPLVGPECRRALARGWLILVRALAALVVMGLTLFVLWWWWMSLLANPSYLPYSVFRDGLTIIDGVLVTIALVLAPAVLAGSLAGEKERGALGLLLTTWVTPREIVSGRMAGKLTQVVMIVLAGVPALVLLAALAGMHADVIAALIALPVVVAIGGGGLATAVSAVSRRGRDALLTVYLVDLLFLLFPLTTRLGLHLGVLDWLAVLNPYAPLDSLVWQEDPTAALVSMGLWGGIGIAGLAVASWRLSPSCLSQLDGGRIGRSGRRRGRIPPVAERPMLWKELYIERVGSLGGFGWWLGALLTLLLTGGSLGLAAVIAWMTVTGGDREWIDWARDVLKIAVGGSAMFVGWVIEWAIGLRAAVVIASERERGTWDAILTSPLEGKEIIRAKLWGCLYALRWLFAAALLAWTVAAVAGAIPPDRYLDRVIGTLVGGTFMAAVGLRCSLASATATKAMTVTIGTWLGAQVVFRTLAAIVFAIVGISLFLSSSALTGAAPSATPVVIAIWTGPLMAATWLVALHGSFIIATFFLVGSSRLLFDRLAGRRAGGRVAVAADQMVYGDPTAPVFPSTTDATSGIEVVDEVVATP